ncbi:MAG TPA: peptide MFS transporter [Gemmatimonadales bacterium]|nr:peptide MFS transporter [Gemmatimonadales bacterium]
MANRFDATAGTATAVVDQQRAGAEAAPRLAADRRFFGHPRGLATLFFTELWERFSYYGMRAILILFMTTSAAQGGLGFDVSRAGAIYGTYVSLVYLLSLPGGWLADRFLGQRRAVLYGGIIIMLGHVCLALPSLTTFFLGLGLIVVGTGLLKPNVSAMVGQLYAPDDTRRDAAFSIFYMGINLGAFIAPLIVGWVAQSEAFRGTVAGLGLTPSSAWHFGFGLAALGMLVGIVQYLQGWKHLGDAGLHPNVPDDPARRAADRRTLRLGAGATIVVALLLGALHSSGVMPLTPEGVANALGAVLLVTTVVVLAYLVGVAPASGAERRGLLIVTLLVLASVVFWSVFEQAGSTLNLFAERDTRTELLGFDFPASWLQSVNAMFLILLAPVFAWIWIRLGRRDPSSPAKFSLGLVFVGLGFVLLVPPARDAMAGEKASPLWLVGTYLCHTIGELLLSPVGLSAMTKLAPARLIGFVMGVWFLSISVGNYVGGRVAGLYESFSLPTLFGVVGGVAVGAGLLMALMVKPAARIAGSTD